MGFREVQDSSGGSWKVRRFLRDLDIDSTGLPGDSRLLGRSFRKLQPSLSELESCSGGPRWIRGRLRFQ